MAKRYFVCPKVKDSDFCQECPLLRLYGSCVIRSERIKSRDFTESPLVNRNSDRHLVYGQDRAISEKIMIAFLVVVCVTPTILISLWEPLFALVAVVCIFISVLIVRARIKTNLRLEGS